MRPPVFVVGCPRSGTTLLFHTLLSAGGFSIYRAETHAFDVIGPKYGSLRQSARRHHLANTLAKGRLIQRTSIRATFSACTLDHCRNAADVLRVLMESIAAAQHVDRWADCTPQHVLFLKEIKKAFPDAIIIHVIRDGRDVALSLQRLGWVRPFAWDGDSELEAASLFWRWMVMRGRSLGESIQDYHEVRFEDLVLKPEETLAALSERIGHALDPETIRRNAIGSVSAPNTSFEEDLTRERFSPVGRFRTGMSEADLVVVERAAGDLLGVLGYETRSNGRGRGPGGERWKRFAYNAHLDLKHWVKTRTPLARRLVDTSLLE